MVLRLFTIPAARYEGNPCVVKVFDFHATHHSIPTFIQEVVLHVRWGPSGSWQVWCHD